MRKKLTKQRNEREVEEGADQENREESMTARETLGQKGSYSQGTDRRKGYRGKGQFKQKG